MHKDIKNKKLLITGGAGSLGKALVKRLLSQNNEIVVFSRDEGKQALTYGNNKDVKCIIGDIRDFEKVNVSLKREKPDLVIHTAALKRIDDMEYHPDECMKTNVQGSENVAKASLLNDIEKCILVSTDKACQPVNVYGSSKFIAERIFTNYDFHSTNTIFSSVRYGNVMGSRGSVIKKFIEFKKMKKPIQITDLRMTRFNITLEESVKFVDLVIKKMLGGELFVPKLKSYKITDLIASIFGDAGMHTRAAVSTNSLPLGVSVEVDAIFELI